MPFADFPPGGVLTLDLASTVGWAYGPLDAVNPCCGIWLLPKTGGEGLRFVVFENTLAAAMEKWQPARMVVEAPLSFQALLGVSNMRVMCQQYTLRGIAYMEAARAQIAISEVSADLIRGELLGQSRFDKGTVKGIVTDYCRKRGIRAPDHNAADACMIWLWHRGQVAPRRLIHVERPRMKEDTC